MSCLTDEMAIITFHHMANMKIIATYTVYITIISYFTRIKVEAVRAASISRLQKQTITHENMQDENQNYLHSHLDIVYQY